MSPFQPPCLKTMDYRFAHFRLRSELELPYLRPWTGPADHPPDIGVTLGTAEPFPDATEVGGCLFLDGRGNLLVRSPEPLDIRVADRCRITVQLRDPGVSPLLHTRILTIPLGFTCYHLGSPPLHGGLVDIDGTLIAICAPSGSGKSTLVATLLGRGHGLLSDDLCVVRPAPDGGLLAYSGVGTLKLGDASIEALGLDQARLAPEGGLSAKRVHSFRDNLVEGARRLRAILYLEPGADSLAIDRIPAIDAPRYLDRLYYRPYLALGLPREELYGHFLGVLRSAPLHVLRRPDDLSRIQDVAAAVEDFARRLADTAGRS